MIKAKTYRLVEKGSHGNNLNLIFDYTILSLILLSVISIVLESVHEINVSYNRIFSVFNVLSVIIFSIEYLMRLYVSDLTHPSSTRFKSKLRFMFSFQGLIDLLAILPFYLPMFIKLDLRFIRVLRLTRFFRVLKINRYNNSLKLIGAVIKEKKPELTVTMFVTFLVLLLASFLIYHIEGEAQPESFPNILASFWWAIATLTTVGYGDVYPITGLGKLISGVIAVMGIGIVALPTGLVSAGFVSKIEQQNNICPHCKKQARGENNGEIARKKEGVL